VSKLIIPESLIRPYIYAMHITYIHRQNTSRTHEVGNEEREQTFSHTHTHTHTNGKEGSYQ